MSRVNLRFNVGYLLNAPPGTQGEIDFEYPRMKVEDTVFKPLAGKMELTRAREGIYVNGRFQTQTAMECARCLENTMAAVEGRIEELFYFPPSMAPEGEFTVDEDANIDLGPLIRELSVIERPLRPLCRPDCKGLCDICGQNLNEGDCDCEPDNIDPRLAALKQLLDEE